MAEKKSVVPVESGRRSLAAGMMETIKEPALDACVDVLEGLLDMLTDDGVLKDLPIVGWLVGLGRSLLSVPDRLFLKKLGRFLSELNQVPETERRAFADKIERDGSTQKVGEKILMIVDQLDDTEKASLAGQVFSACLRRMIDIDQFYILCSCIRLTRIADIDALLLNDDGVDSMDPTVVRALCLTGLADWEIRVPRTIGDVGSSKTGIFYTISSYGSLLTTILKDRKDRLRKKAFRS